MPLIESSTSQTEHRRSLPQACARFLAGPGASSKGSDIGSLQHQVSGQRGVRLPAVDEVASRGGPRGRVPKRFAPMSIQAYYRSASLILDKGASRLILFLTEERHYDTTLRGLEPIPRYLHRNSP